MLIPWVTFIGIAGSISLRYWLLVIVPEGRDQVVLKRRLKGGAGAGTRRALSLLKETEQLSRIPLLNALLNRSGHLTAQVQNTIDQSALPLNLGRFLLLSATAGAAAYLAVSVYTRLWWLSLPALVGASLIPLVVVRIFATRRIHKFEEQFPEAIDLIARAMRAGHAFTTGLKIAADELPPPAGIEFRRLYERQNYGAQMTESLRAFADAVPSLDARFFVTAVLTQRETGGNLSEVLDRLAAVMRERFRIRRDVRVKSAHGRTTVYILAAMPPTLAIVLMVSSPEQFSILLTDPLGNQMLAGAVFLQVVGLLIVRKLVNIEYLSHRNIDMSLELILTLVAVFVLVSFVVILAGSFAGSQTTGRKRLRDAAPTIGPVVLPEIVSLSGPGKTESWHLLLKMFARSDKEMSRLRTKMLRAGYRQPSAPLVYAALEMLMPFVAALAPLIVLGPRRGWMAALVVALFAFFVPGLVVGRSASRRMREIENGLPDALDLLVVCIEAGSGLDQAIVKTSNELTIAYPTLAEELKIVTTEIRAGKPRMDAFKSLAQRTKVDDVRALVAMLLQTDRFGTSVGQALRTHADTSRTKRRQRAEERAQKVGVKLVFPLVLFFFPAFYVVILGSAIIHFVRDFK